MLADQFIERRRTEHRFAVDLIDHFADHFFDRVQIGFRLQRIGHAVELAPRQLGVVVLGIVFVMLEADGRYQAMSHQRAGGRDRMDQSQLDHVADDQIHLADGHGAADREKAHAVLIAGHRFKSFCAARHLRRQAAIGSQAGDEGTDRAAPAVQPFIEGGVNHRHDEARIGEHGVGEKPVTHLAGPRHVEGVDKDRARLGFL